MVNDYRFFKASLFVIFWTALNTHGQAQNYLPAVIHFASGESQVGEIFYNFGNNSPRSIRFRDARGKLHSFDALAVRAFSLTRTDGHSEHYVGRQVWINRSPIRVAELETHPVPRMARDTAFLQVLIDGRLPLYSFIEDNRQQFFVEKDTLHTLIFKPYYRQADVRREISQNNRYRQQLLALTLDRPDLQERILKLPYQQGPLVSLLADYQSADALRYRWKPEAVSASWHLLAGVSRTEVGYPGLDFKPKLQPNFGIRLVLPFARTNNRFALQTDLFVRGVRANAIQETATATVHYRLNFWQLRFNPMFAWAALNRPRRKVLLKAGFYTIVARIDDNHREIVYDDPAIPAKTEYSFPKMRPLESNLSTGIALAFPRTSIELRYDFVTNIFNSERIYAPSNAYSLLFSYHLWK